MSEKTTKKLRLGLPKGSLQESTFALLAKAGWKLSSSSRSYIPRVDDSELELRLIRAQEISRYVEHGFLDAGLTGADWPGPKVHPVAWKLEAVATDGTPLAVEKSFLWAKPGQ